MKFVRLLSLAPALLLAIALWPGAARAGNTVWVGVTGTAGVQEAFSGECMGVSPRLEHTSETVGQIGVPESHYEIVDDGVMKAWTALGYTQAADNNPPSHPPDGNVRFDLLRPFGSRHPTKIAESQPATHLDGITSNPFTTEVQAGDGMGVDLESNSGNEESQAWIGCTAGSFTGFGANNGIWSPPLVADAGPAGEPEESADPAYGLELGAEIEYDAPVITGISPASGPLAGESKVTITGEHLRYSDVHVGGIDSGKYEDTDTTAVIRVPPGKAEGPVDVVLKTAGGTATLVGGYTYGSTGGGSDGGSGSGGSGSGGSPSTPAGEILSQPNPGPLPSPASPAGSGTTEVSFKKPKVRVAKPGGLLSLDPIAPSAGAFHVQGVVVAAATPHASHTRSIVYGSAIAHAKAAGPVAIKLAPDAAAKDLLVQQGSLTVHLTISFLASSGGRSSRSVAVTVHAD
ncbi:MAG TPA: IPT/TIG domain-containing protein [Solirubrobacterales bacterium]|nr:IPT/TIG domain-containing protein [Solirubrobacterales bacterium]